MLTGLKGAVDLFDKKLKEDDIEVTKFDKGVNNLVFGMIGWLAVVTVATIVVFVVIYKRLGREDPSDVLKLPADVESVDDQSSYIRSSIINFHHIPSQLSKASSIASVHSINTNPQQAHDSSSSSSSASSQRSESPSNM